MKTKLDFSLCLITTLAFAGALLRAAAWPFGAAIFPLAATTVGLALATAGMLAPLLGASRDKPGPTETGLEPKEAVTFGWILSFFALVALAGFQWGLPLATLIYLKLEGKVPTIPTVIYSGGCWLFLYAARAWLHLPLHEGLVFLGSI